MAEQGPGWKVGQWTSAEQNKAQWQNKEEPRSQLWSEIKSPWGKARDVAQLVEGWLLAFLVGRIPLPGGGLYSHHCTHL